MTAFDYLDLGIIITLYGAVFLFGGNKRRWLETVSLLAFHLVAARYCIYAFDNPIPALSFAHAGLSLAFLAYSETNYGRAVGVCFLAMTALDGLTIDGILSPEILHGLHFNYWNIVSTLQHVQAATLFLCFWRYRQASWALV